MADTEHQENTDSEGLPRMTTPAFLETVITPVLQDLGRETVALDSPAAAKLLMMTACHESAGLYYRRQVGGGPALSFFQIEPGTLEDLYTNFLAYRPQFKAVLDSYLPAGMSRIDALATEDRYACAAARLLYWRHPAPIPAVTDDEGLAQYAKEYWNTALGAATAENYLDDFKRWGPAPAPKSWAA
ncbi:MAG: hypothetical protein HWE08_13475 [Alphaproteobacteria bacterium]|nr:hypothetical protein [Alphaproteobacteria bacterium]